jgi:SPOR domain
VRLAFFALLFVNLAYFAWAHWIDVPRPAPVNEAIAHLPRLKMADELPPAEQPQPHAQKTALNATTACMSLGPFGDLANSTRAAVLLRAKGFDPQQRAEHGQSSEGYWVYVGGLATQADADRALVTLERTGIKDALVMPETAEAGRRLSLGLYSERSRAERRAEAVRQAGLKTEIAVRKLPSTLYWVELTPPPGTNTLPLRDLFAEGVSSRVAVQPCPEAATTSPAAASATGTAAANVSAQEPATASNPPARAVGLPKPP